MPALTCTCSTSSSVSIRLSTRLDGLAPEGGARVLDMLTPFKNLRCKAQAKPPTTPIAERSWIAAVGVKQGERQNFAENAQQTCGSPKLGHSTRCP